MTVGLKEARSRGGRPSRDEVPLRNERLLTIATDAFVSQGYDATTIEGIAATAGVAKRTIYSRYPNKKALFFEIVRRLTERRPYDVFAIDDGVPIEEGLRQCARAMIGISLRPESIALQRMVLSELKTFPELGRTQWDIVEKEHGAAIAAYFRSRQSAEGLRSVDPTNVADLFMRSVFSFINNVLILDYDIPSNEETDKFVDTLIDILMNGVRK
jgi:TetR/AcrR family transcriptional regulator, mexJK operon transcriptional repressor